MYKLSRTLLQIAVVGILVLLPCYTRAQGKTIKTLGHQANDPIPDSYFGMQLKGDTWPSVPLGSSRVPVTWKFVEPKHGDFDFTKIDAQVDQAQQHGADVLFDLGLTPPWASPHPDGTCVSGPGSCWAPTSILDWRNFITAVAKRNKGRVHYYQIWNEPSQAEFWQDTTQNMVVLAKNAYNIIKGVDPSNMVVSPAPAGRRITPWLKDFLSKGGGRYFDIFGFHAYPSPQPPESLFAEILPLHDLADKNGLGERPFWDTELGWWYPNTVLPGSTQAAYAARLIILEHVAGVSRFYWYIWNFGGSVIVMLDRDGKLSPPAQAYATVHKWLVGAVLPSCTSSDVPKTWEASHSMWTCDLIRNGVTSKIVWNPDGDTQFQVPADWRIKTTQNLAGDTKPLPPSGYITIGEQPILLQPK